jgi:hypothetical protein
VRSRGPFIVVKARDRSAAQRRLADPTATATPGSLSITGTVALAARPVQLSERST